MAAHDHVELLTVLLGPKPETEAVVFVATNHPPTRDAGPGTWTQCQFRSIALAAEYLEKAAPNAETYCACAWFRGSGGRQKVNVIAKRTICADIDDKAMPGRTPEERHRQARSLAGSVPAPSILIDSGGGFHPHLLLPDGERLEDFGDQDDGRRHVEMLGIAFRLYLEDRAQEIVGSRVTLDVTDGAERCWRAPGSLNMKAPGNEKALTADRSACRPVRLVAPARASALPSVAAADLSFLQPFMGRAEELWDEREAKNRGGVATRAPAEPNKYASNVASVAVANEGDVHFTPKLLESRLQAKWPMDDGGDQSKHDMAVASSLAEQGWAPEVATAAILLRRSLLSAAADRAKGLRPDYLRRTCHASYAKAGPAQESRALRHQRPFPVAALPKLIARYVRAAALSLSCAVEALVLPLLTALGAAIANSRRIQIKPDWREPPLLWSLVVMPSGTLKTPAQNVVLGPYRQRQTDRFHAFKKAMRQFKADEEKHKLESRAWEKEMGDDPSRAAWKGNQPEPPTAPTLLRCLVSDITVEALAALLSENPRGVLLERDELGAWFDSFGTYKGGRGGDLQAWLSIHNAGPILVDRKGNRETLHVESAFVGLCGGIQPDALRRVLTDAFVECGLIARFLLAMPKPHPKQWSEASIPSRVKSAMQRLFDRLFGLKGTLCDSGRYRPTDLPLSADAKALWVKRFTHFAHRQHRHAHDPAVGPALSKLEAYTARFALIIEIVAHASEDEQGDAPTCISVASVASAIELTDWFADEAIRVYARLRETKEDRQTREFVGWIEGRGGKTTAREVQRMGPRRLRGSSDAARDALAQLVKAGWGYWWLRPAPKTGGRAKTEFALRGDGDTRPDEAPFVAGLEERVSPGGAENGGDDELERGSGGCAAPPRHAPVPGHQSAPSHPTPAEVANDVAAQFGGEVLWVRPVEPPGNSEPGPCPACRGTDFWASRWRDRVCRRCHPPAPGAEVTS